MILGQFAHAGTITGATPQGTIRFGMNTVVREGTQALLAHSRASHYRFVASPPSVDAVRAEMWSIMPGLARGRLPEVTVESLIDFVYRHGQAPDAWLDLGGDVKRPHRFRRRVGGSYPIAIIPHSVSYGYCLHDWFLPLLLGDVRACDSVVCTSPSGLAVVRATLDHLTEDLNRRGLALPYRGRLDVVPLGVDVERFRPAEANAKDAARIKFGIPLDAFALLWVGRISSQDKADLVPLLAVLRAIGRERPAAHVHLLIAGTPRDVEAQILATETERLGIANHVIALGQVPDDNLPTLYQAADVFVSPVDSTQEMFGISVIEAMASGLPVICSDWVGYRDSVVPGETGILVGTSRMVPDPAAELAADFAEWSLQGGEMLDQWVQAQSTTVDMDELARAVVDLYDHPDRRRQMGEAGRRRAIAEFAWPQIVELWDDLLDDLRTCDATPIVSHTYERPHLAGLLTSYRSTGTCWNGKTWTGERAPKAIDPRPHFRLAAECAEYPEDSPPGAFRVAWEDKHEVEAAERLPVRGDGDDLQRLETIGSPLERFEAKPEVKTT